MESHHFYIGKLIRVIHFVARNNLTIKSLYSKTIISLSYQLEEWIRQYIGNCPGNISHTLHETSDPL